MLNCIDQFICSFGVQVCLPDEIGEACSILSPGFEINLMGKEQSSYGNSYGSIWSVYAKSTGS
jgi:hypothetical protein